MGSSAMTSSGLHHHGPGQAHALTLTAGKFMGIAGQMLRQQAHLANHRFHLLHTIRLVFKEVEIIQALGNDIVNGGAFVQGGGGILEHHLDIPDHLMIQRPGNLAGDAHALYREFRLRSRDSRGSPRGRWWFCPNRIRPPGRRFPPYRYRRRRSSPPSRQRSPLPKVMSTFFRDNSTSLPFSSDGAVLGKMGNAALLGASGRILTRSA